MKFMSIRFNGKSSMGHKTFKRALWALQSKELWLAKRLFIYSNHLIFLIKIEPQHKSSIIIVFNLKERRKKSYMTPWHLEVAFSPNYLVIGIWNCICNLIKDLATLWIKLNSYMNVEKLSEYIPFSSCICF